MAPAFSAGGGAEGALGTLTKQLIHGVAEWLWPTLKPGGAGITSAVRVQMHANNLVDDGITLPTAVRVSRIGYEYMGSKNHNGRLEELLLTCGVGHQFVVVSEGPSRLFQSLHSNPLQFKLRLGADLAALRQFWVPLLSTEDGRELQALNPYIRGRSIGYLQYCLPLRLHEDGGFFTKTQSRTLFFLIYIYIYIYICIGLYRLFYMLYKAILL